MKPRSGGGITSNKLINKPVVTGSAARTVNPGGADALGQKFGGAQTPFYGQKIPGVGSQPLGNETSQKIKAMGQGRTVHARGTQNQWGAAVPGNPPAKNKDILSGYGPEYRGNKR